jgi:Spy/CpxP family protein refolding chaperone
VLGVRRPLRFLAYKLELSEAQVAVFAAILDELKTERAQAAVDQRRRTSALAETLESATFDEQRVRAIGDDQRQSDEKIHAAVARALKKMHEALDDEQRKRLAYLLRTGALTM